MISENYKFFIVAIILTLILIIVLFVLKKMTAYNYLNYNSTFFGGSTFNPSDIAYEEVADELDRQVEVMDFIKKVVNAGDDAKVIFTSGATEGIASVMNWCKNINKYGSIVGSELDHESVQANVENYGFKYKQLNLFDVNDNKKQQPKEKFPEDTAMIFMTHISSRTGEVYPLEITQNLQYLTKTLMAGGSEPENTNSNVKTLQQRPLRVLDITQSIGKIKIDMIKYDIDAAMFSLHKLGGELGAGVLIIRDSNLSDDKKFKPLIAGNQQNGLRGGTYNAYIFNNFPILYKDYPYDYESCKTRWLSAEKYISEHLDENARLKPKLIQPKLDHVYNTLLIELNDCGMGVIKQLSDKGIYISSSTACSTNSKNKFIRISFLKDKDLSDKVLKQIVDAINYS